MKIYCSRCEDCECRTIEEMNKLLQAADELREYVRKDALLFAYGQTEKVVEQCAARLPPQAAAIVHDFIVESFLRKQCDLLKTQANL